MPFPVLVNKFHQPIAANSPSKELLLGWSHGSMTYTSSSTWCFLWNWTASAFYSYGLNNPERERRRKNKGSFFYLYKKKIKAKYFYVRDTLQYNVGLSGARSFLKKGGTQPKKGRITKFFHQTLPWFSIFLGTQPEGDVKQFVASLILCT